MINKLKKVLNKKKIRINKKKLNNRDINLITNTLLIKNCRKIDIKKDLFIN